MFKFVTITSEIIILVGKLQMYLLHSLKHSIQTVDLESEKRKFLQFKIEMQATQGRWQERVWTQSSNRCNDKSS